MDFCELFYQIIKAGECVGTPDFVANESEMRIGLKPMNLWLLLEVQAGG